MKSLVMKAGLYYIVFGNLCTIMTFADVFKTATVKFRKNSHCCWSAVLYIPHLNTLKYKQNNIYIYIYIYYNT